MPASIFGSIISMADIASNKPNNFWWWINSPSSSSVWESESNDHIVWYYKLSSLLSLPTFDGIEELPCDVLPFVEVRFVCACRGLSNGIRGSGRIRRCHRCWINFTAANKMIALRLDWFLYCSWHSILPSRIQCFLHLATVIQRLLFNTKLSCHLQLHNLDENSINEMSITIEKWQ